MRVVLDTNILISALLSKDGSAALCLRYWTEKRFDLISSDWQIEELRRVSKYKEIRKYLKHSEVGTLINAINRKALVIEDLPTVSYSIDVDDNPIIASAIKGKANYIVSGDKNHLLELSLVDSIPILSLQKFISLF